MTQPLAVDVLTAVHPLVARAAECHEIVRVEPSLRSGLPRFDVVKMERPTARRCDAATKAGAVVSGDRVSTHALPRAGCIDPLSLGADAAAPPRVPLPRHAMHTVRLPLKPWASARGRLGHQLAALGSVLPSGPVRLISRLRPRVVAPMEVVPARSRRDSKVLQLLVDSLGISAHKRRDLVGRKPLYLVLLTEPCGVKVRRLVCHATYHSPKNGGTP